MSELNLKIFILLETFVLALANTETVHLTNSQSHLLSSPSVNFTTYKLTVPGSAPITIIEDTNQQPLRLTDNDNERGHPQSIRNGERYTDKELISLSQSAQQRLNNRNQDVRATLSFQISDPDKTDHGTEADPDPDKKKVVYSPSLLKRFIKEYSDKIKNADQSTKNALKEIERINKKQTNQDEQVTTDRMDFSSDDNIEEKYNNWNNRYSDRHQSQSNPYNDKDGWVTLEAVPWSSSKVSKWHPHNNKFNSYENKNSYNLPHQSSYGNNDDHHQSFPKPLPSHSHYNDELDEDYIDDHPNGKPVYTSYNPHRPETNSRPQYSGWSHNQNSGYDKKPTYKPRPRPQYDYGQSNSHSLSNSHSQSPYDADQEDSSENWYDIDRNSPKPWSQDIITDNRPSDFPIRSPSKRPHSHSSDRDPTKYRPFSHPENGNGEWVLVSTTKGYQRPNRHGQRAMSLSNIQPNDLTSHHSVKLTVLPAKNNTFSYDRKPMALSHGGMLEVESSFESVEDSAATASSSVKKPIAKKRKVYRNVPMKKGITSDDGSAVLAAVGAGMVPATMAMLMPMVLGRRKRNIDDYYRHQKPLVLKDFK